MNFEYIVLRSSSHKIRSQKLLIALQLLITMTRPQNMFLLLPQCYNICSALQHGHYRDVLTLLLSVA